MTMFSPGKDAHKEKWDGASTGYPEIERVFKADAALPISTFTSQLKSLASLYSHIFIDLPEGSPRKITKSLLKYLTSPLKSDAEGALESLSSVKRRALAPEVAKLRAVKSTAEQAAMHSAATLSGRAHAKTMRFAQPGMTESKLAARFEYACALGGAQRPAYVPVVASGANALIIHYTSNNMVLGEDDLVLIDAGCELNGYASDISEHTVPPSVRLLTRIQRGRSPLLASLFPRSTTSTPPSSRRKGSSSTSARSPTGSACTTCTACP
jgi:intermediate cleaving peptidase 55